MEAVARANATDGGDVHLATFAGLALCTSVATWYREDGRLTLDDIIADLPTMYAPLASARTRAAADAAAS